MFLLPFLQTFPSYLYFLKIQTTFAAKILVQTPRCFMNTFTP